MALKTKKRIIETTISQNDSENESGNDSEESIEAEGGNAGWADSIAKVLSTTKPKTKKTLVLSRAKKIKATDKKRTDDFGFEVEGEVKEEKPDKEQLNDNLKHKKNVHLTLRVKPSWKDIERERALRKVATRGVVQLFNAVRIQQKDLQQQLDEAGPLDSRKEAVLNNINKRKFLDVLMGGKRAKSEAVDNTVKNEINDSEDDSEGESEASDAAAAGKKKSEWSVLRQDFMTNKKIKHWDEDENDSDVNDDADSE